MHLTERIYNKANREGKQLLRDARHLFGVDDIFYRNARGSRILIYHGISPKNYGRFNPIFLKLSTFEAHLSFYKKYFNVVSLDDLYHQRISNTRFNVCLTFDDGFENNYKYVLPLLHKYNLPATFFVTAIRQAGYDILWNDFLTIASKYGPAKITYAGRVYNKNQFNRYVDLGNVSLAQTLRATGFDEKLRLMGQLYPEPSFSQTGFDTDLWLQMTEQQIQDLSTSPLITIGAHGYYHNDLGQIGIDDAVAEMERSKQFLEYVIQKPIDKLAFPYGSYTRPVVDVAKQLGYKQLLAMDFHYAEDQTDDTMRERFTVNPYLSTINQMHATITKKYD